MTNARRADVVVLDRIEPGWTPPYCTHGRATCIGCDEWCWMGSETYKLLVSGDYQPLCHQCAVRFAPPGTKCDGHVDDHLRADGPHD